MEADIVPGSLKIIDGTYADFEPESGDEGSGVEGNASSEKINGKIVLKYLQGKTSNLSVYMKSNDTKTHLGFCFEQKEKSYVLGVEGEKFCFKIQAKDRPKDFGQEFLWTWDSNKGSYGSLKTVTEPVRYLCVQKKEVTLSSEPDNHFKVETTNIQSRMLCMPNSSLRVGHTIMAHKPHCNTRHTRMQCRRLCCVMEPQQKVRNQSRKRKAPNQS
ncbi:uncharacterized protein LOC113653377 [Tachysurus fulvidraco]|uniref:uncharacterized protein LOC113653377 n=1 Tax=Tachysurus fulvidraco TaxID=1234273 RepID=UPI001FED39BD|nr:uncharacterized protein LOC113653377 [Tachysurus fulvidraco]